MFKERHTDERINKDKWVISLAEVVTVM